MSPSKDGHHARHPEERRRGGGEALRRPPRLRREPDRHGAGVVRLRRLLRRGRPGLRRPVLPLGGPAHRHAPGVLHLCGRLCVAPAGRVRLRPPRRCDRPQEGADRHAGPDRRGDVPDRRPARVLDGRCGRPDRPGRAALRAGRRRRRRVGRCRTAVQRVRGPTPPRLLRLRRPGRPARRKPAGQRRPGRPRRAADRGAVRVVGLACGVPVLRRPRRVRAVDPGEAGGDPGLQGDGGRALPARGADPRGVHHPAPRPARRDPVPRRPRRAVRHVHRLRPHVRHPGTRHVTRLRPRGRAHRLLRSRSS
ncbi:hypothetical protein SPURM210S_02010 [Streptomyces purpurascens]